MITDIVILSTACLNQPAIGQRPARTLMVGAATLHIRHRFGAASFDLQANSTTVTDNPADTIVWLGDRLSAATARLLLWRIEDIAVPSLIAAAETSRDHVAALKMLCQLERLVSGEVVDVAHAFGGAQATSFDAVAHQHGLPFVPMTRDDLAEFHRIGDHGAIREHLAARVTATWRLWLHGQPDNAALIAATDAWMETPESQVRL